MPSNSICNALATFLLPIENAPCWLRLVEEHEETFAYLLPFSLLASTFFEVESFGSSLMYSMNSGAPGIYLRRGSGTFSPWTKCQNRPNRPNSLVRPCDTYVLGLVVL